MKTLLLIFSCLLFLQETKSQNCDSVLVQTKFKFSSKTELAQHIHQQMQHLDEKTKSNSTGFAANIVLPTSAGPIPLGLKYDNSKSESDYEQTLNDFENETNQSIQVNQEMSFVPPNQIEAWSRCIEQVSNSMFAMLYPGKGSTKNQLILNLYLTSKYHEEAITNERKIVSLIYTNAKGELINDSTSWQTLRGGNILTKIFTINALEDFYAAVTFEGYSHPIEYTLKKNTPINPVTFINHYTQAPLTLGMIEWFHTRTLVIQGFEPNKKVLVNVDYCLEKQCPLDFGGGARERCNLRFAVEANGVHSSCNKEYHYTTGGPMPPCDCNFNSADIITTPSGNVILKFENHDSTCHDADHEDIKVHIRKIEITTL